MTDLSDRLLSTVFLLLLASTHRIPFQVTMSYNTPYSISLIWPAWADAKHPKQLTLGWWVGTNHNGSVIAKSIEMARNVVHIRYDDGLLVELGE